MFREIGFPPRTLLGFQNRFFKAWNRAILDVCGSQSDSSELLLVTPLAFSDLALALLGGTLLMGGCSGIEVLLIWMLHWSLFAAITFCWFSKLLITALPCCSLDCVNGIMHSSVDYCHFRGERVYSPH